MEHAHYTVILEKEDDGGYHAFVPALKGCHSQGDTLEEAIANITEAIELYLDSLKAHGEPVPVEDTIIKPVEVAARRPSSCSNFRRSAVAHNHLP